MADTRNVTVNFDDGTSHNYKNVPKDVTPDQIEGRAHKEFSGKKVKNIAGDSGPSTDDKPVVQKPTEKSFGQKAIEFLEPTAEALGTAGGALIGGTAGTFGAGPVGTAVGGAVGAGLGYGAAKEIGQNIKEKLGYAPVRTGKQLISQPIENVATGATYELGGQALPSILQGAGKLGASISNLLTRTPETRAAKIVSESLGPNLAQAREVLKSASSDLTASQALGQLETPNSL